jgi:hypothetical protein
MLLHPDLGRDVMNSFTDLLTDAGHWSAAGAGLFFLRQVMNNFVSGQLWRERFSAPLFAGVLKNGDLLRRYIFKQLFFKTRQEEMIFQSLYIAYFFRLGTKYRSL